MTYIELLACNETKKRVLIGGHKYNIVTLQTVLHPCGKVSVECTFRRNSTEISLLTEVANLANQLPFPCETPP